MREIRLSGSEGGGTELNRFSLPLSEHCPPRKSLPKKRGICREIFSPAAPAGAGGLLARIFSWTRKIFVMKNTVSSDLECRSSW